MDCWTSSFTRRTVPGTNSKSKQRCLFLGLDAAGKTTILYRLKLNEVVTTIPTIGFNVETVNTREFGSIICWDVGTYIRLYVCVYALKY